MNKVEVKLPIQTFYNTIVLGLLRHVCDKNKSEAYSLRQTISNQMPIIYKAHFEHELLNLNVNLSSDEMEIYNNEFEKALQLIMSEINQILDTLTSDNRLSAESITE